MENKQDIAVIELALKLYEKMMLKKLELQWRLNYHKSFPWISQNGDRIFKYERKIEELEYCIPKQYERIKLLQQAISDKNQHLFDNTVSTSQKKDKHM